MLGKLPSVRDSSEHCAARSARPCNWRILFGSLMAANAMGGGLGILVVGGLYLLNEAMGRVVVRMAAAPAAVVVGGVLLNVLYWLDLFTPVKRLTGRRSGRPVRPRRHGREGTAMHAPAAHRHRPAARLRRARTGARP